MSFAVFSTSFLTVAAACSSAAASEAPVRAADSVSASIPQDPPPPDSVAIHVTSAVARTPINEAFVQVTGDAMPGGVSSVSGADGWAWFPTLVPQAPVNGEPIPTPFTVEVARVGFLPFKKVMHFSDSERLLSCPLVPSATGYSTPLIRHDQRAVVEIVGLGTLRVATGALSQDVTLRVIPIPSESWTTTLPVEQVLRYQVWLAAYDAAGQPAPTALPTTPGAITLELDVPSPFPLPEGATNEVWTTHCVGDAFAYDLTCVAQRVPGGADKDRVTIPLGYGHNLLYQTYTTAETTCPAVAGPWTYHVVFLGLRTSVLATVPVICGVHTATGGCGLKAGEEVLSSLTWTDANYAKYGINAGTAIGRVNAEAGTSSEYKEETRQVVTRAREGKVEKADGSTITSRPAGQQGGGYDCVSGSCHFGEVFRKYRVLARRSWTCNGAILSETKNVAEVEVFAGLQVWYDVQWDASCAGCAATGTVPPSVPRPR